MNFADEIKSRVTMQEVAERYGFEVNRSGFICCPFHGEKTASLKCYPGDRGFYCFGCHTGGTVIDFVERYFNLSYKETVEKMNEDFSLNLPIGRHISRNRKIAIARDRFLRDREKSARDKLDDEYRAALDDFTELDRAVQAGPESPGFFEALGKIDDAKYRLECAEIARNDYGRNK